MSSNTKPQQDQDAGIAAFRLQETKTNRSADFSTAEDTQLDAAREVWSGLKRTFQSWMVLGRGVRIIRQRADQIGGRKTFQRLMAEQGFQMDGPKAQRQFNKVTATRLLQVMAREPEVIEWHESLSPADQIAWASPDAVLNHCPIFAKPKDPDTSLSPFEKLKQVNLDLQERLHRAEEEIKRGGGDLWTKDDRPEDIANIMMSKLSRIRLFAWRASYWGRPPRPGAASPPPPLPVRRASN